MKKQDKKQISKLIKGLPSMALKDEIEYVKVKGSTLISRGIKHDASTQDIDPKKYYVSTRPKQINHRTEAEKYYKKFGITGVELYRSEVLRVFEAENTSRITA